MESALAPPQGDRTTNTGAVRAKKKHAATGAPVRSCGARANFDPARPHQQSAKSSRAVIRAVLSSAVLRTPRWMEREPAVDPPVVSLPAPHAERALRIVSWNVAGLRSTWPQIVQQHGSMDVFFRTVLQADIVCLQETKLSADQLTRDMACVPGYESYWAFSTARKGYSGVATYVHSSWAVEAADAQWMGDARFDQEGRVVATDHGAFVLVNVYTPNAGVRPARTRLGFKLEFLRALQRKCAWRRTPERVMALTLVARRSASRGRAPGASGGRHEYWASRGGRAHCH